jgi:hypothetical protein
MPNTFVEKQATLNNRPVAPIANRPTNAHSSRAVNARGAIFFPPGQYLISAPLTFTQEWPRVQFMGCGSEQSMLFGGVNGYLIDRPTFDNTNSGQIIVEKLALRNQLAAPDCGCVRVRQSFTAQVRECYLEGWRPVTYFGVMGEAVRNCRIVSIGPHIPTTKAQSIGCMMYSAHGEKEPKPL